MTRRWTEHLTVLGAYTLIALVLSYPLVLHLKDQIPGVQGDVWSYLWAMGWARVSTLDLRVNPFRDDFVFYPLGGATQLLWATALPSFVSIPLQLAIGLVPAFNLMYLAATVLTAYGTFLLAKFVLNRSDSSKNPSPAALKNGRRGEVRSTVTPAAFVAGLAFAFSALRLGYGLSFTNLYHTELIPFYILFLLKTHYEGGWRNSILAGLLLGLNVYIDFQIAAFLILFTALWFIAALLGWEHAQKKAPSSINSRPSSGLGQTGLRRLAYDARIKYVALIAIVSFFTAAPMIAIVAQDLNVEGSNYIRVYPLKYSAARSYDILSYILPNARSSLYQLVPTPQVAGVNAAVNVDGESQLSPDRQAFLGLFVLALALVGAFSRPRALALWIAAAHTLRTALLWSDSALCRGGPRDSFALHRPTRSPDRKQPPDTYALRFNDLPWHRDTGRGRSEQSVCPHSRRDRSSGY